MPHPIGWFLAPLASKLFCARCSSRTVIARPQVRVGAIAITCFVALGFTGWHVTAARSAPAFIPLVTDSARIFTVPEMAKPVHLVPVTDPVFGTKVSRITDDPGNPIVVEAPLGTWSSDARHHFYSDQPWNSDGTLIAIENRGDPTRLILDGETYAPKYGRCPDYAGDDRWHPSLVHPRERIVVKGHDLKWVDVTQCVTTRSWSLPFDVGLLGNGNPSADGRFIALADTSRVFVVDMDPQPPFGAYPAQRIGPAFDLSSCGLTAGCTVRWVSVSASGKYVVASYPGGQVRVLDVNPSTLELTPRAMPESSPHCDDPAQGYIYDVTQGDLTQNPFDANEDVIVGQEHCGNRGRVVNGQLMGGVIMVRLRDGAVTSLTDPTNEALPQSTSARNVLRPGWIYVGYYPQDGKRFSDEIVAVKLDGSGSVQRFAHKRSAFSGCYRCIPHPVPSPDGTRVMFASNWGLNCTPCSDTKTIAGYVVDARNLGPPPNQPPDGTIDSPASDVEIMAGESVEFAAGGVDPEGDLPLAFHWDFGGARDPIDAEDPGVIAFPKPGSFTVTLTVTDTLGLADALPATRKVTVISPKEPAHEVHWTLTGPNSITLNWRGGPNYVRFGLDTGYGARLKAVAPEPSPFSSPGPFREARIVDLLPDQLYHYSIGENPDHTFRTAPPRGTSDFDVFVTADVGSTLAYKTINVLESLIASGAPRFCLLPGDLSYGNSHGQRAVERHFDDMMAWSQDAAYMPAWGNHEWDIPANDDLRNYKGRFDLPNPQTSPGSPLVSCCGEDWYWFDYGNVRFIAYPEPWVGAWADWKKRAGVLMDEAQSDSAITFIVTFGHRPAYSSGHHPGSAKLKGYLDELGSKHDKYVLDLCGHSHNYERTYPQFGVVHVTAGNGGSGLSDDPKNGCAWYGKCPPPAWTASRAMHHGVLKLHFGPSTIEGWAICGPSASDNDMSCTIGDPMDHFVIPPPDTLPPPVVENLVGNPSFETSLAGWIAYGKGSVNRTAGGFKDQFSAEVGGDSTTTWIGLNDSPNWVDTTLAAGEHYRFSAWMRSASGQGRARLRVREWIGPVLQAPAAQSLDVALGTDWKEVALDYSNVSSLSTLDLQALYLPGAPDQTAQIDEISIVRDSVTGPRAMRRNDDPASWDEDELEDGGGAATLGQRSETGLRFEARLHPSPLHDTSVLSFTTTRRGAAQITLFDVAGRAVRTLIRESDIGPGRHDVAIDGRDDRGQRLSPGVYLYRLLATEGSLSGRCVVLP